MLRPARVPLFLVAAAVSGLVAPAGHAEVPKEIKSKYTRVKDLVAKCDERRLEKAKEISKDFPEDLPEIIELRKEIAACEASLKAKVAEKDAVAAKQAEENAALAAGAAKDLENVQSAGAALGEVSQAVGSIATHMIGEMLDALRTWPKAKAEAQRLIDTYGALKMTSIQTADRRVEFDAAARDMWMAVGSLKKSLARTQEGIAAFLSQARGLADKSMSAAEKGAADAVAAKDADAFTGSIRSSLRQAEFYLDQADILYAAGEAGDASWIAAERARAAKVRDSGKALAAEIIKKNVLPKDSYTGGDRAAITAAIKKAWLGANPNSPPIKIILWSDWGRLQKRVWSDAKGGWVRQDYSNLGASVVVKSKDGKYGWWYEVTAQKDHLSGDKLSVVVMPNEGREVPADRTVLISAVK